MIVGVGMEAVPAELSPEDAIREVKGLGFGFAEVPMSSFGSGPTLPHWISAARAAQFQVGSAVIAEFVKLPKLREQERGASLDAISAMLREAATWGCGVVLLPARLSAGEGARERVYVQALTRLAGEAAEVGVTIGVEFVGGSSPDDIASLVRSVDSPHVGVYFDIGNCLYAGTNPIESLTRLIPLVKQIHLKGGPVTPLAAMPLGRVIQIVQQAGCEVNCVLEIEGVHDVLPLRDAASILWMSGFENCAS